MSVLSIDVDKRRGAVARADFLRQLAIGRQMYVLPTHRRKPAS